MQLSVIVPVYNMAAEGKLEYCMDSLVGQTITDMEVIAVDDASADNSLEILRAYQERYPEKVKVIASPVNKRQGGAKNLGLKAAAGEWVGFIDSDDWVTPDYYEKLLAKARETGADVVGCDYSLVSSHTFETGTVVENNTKDQTGILDQEKHRKLLLRPGSMVIKIYRNSVIRENGLCFPEGIFYEDNCAGPLWSLYFTHFERVEEPLYFYYQHDTSTVHRITEERCRDRMRAEEIFYDPRHPYTWALLSSIPDVDSKEKLEAIPGTPPNMIYPPKGDAFAARSRYAMNIDYREEPPMFKVSDTHYAATWLLDPHAPKVEMPKIVSERIRISLEEEKGDE